MHAESKLKKVPISGALTHNSHTHDRARLTCPVLLLSRLNKQVCSQVVVGITQCLPTGMWSRGLTGQSSHGAETPKFHRNTALFSLPVKYSYDKLEI